MNKIIKKLNKIKNFSVVIIPDAGSTGTKSRHLSSSKVFLGLIAYSFIIFLLSAILLGNTALRDIFFEKSNLGSSDIERIEELKEKMLFLTEELESLRSTNKRLKNAIMLGDSTILPKEESDSSIKKKAGGNLLFVINELFLSNQINTLPQNGKITKEPLYYFYKPANAYISRRFNPEKGHFGLDYVLKTGSPVYASAGGYVVFADYTVKDGYMIIISHPDNYVSVYKHCSSLIKRQREIVFQGDLVALSGNTGEESTGPHLHFEIWKDGQPIDPEKSLLNN